MSAPSLPSPSGPQPVDDGVRSSVKMIDNIADAARVQATRNAWDAYLGKFPESLKRDPEEPDLNVYVNRIAPIVDTSIAWLYGDPLGIDIDPKCPYFCGADDDASDADGDEDEDASENPEVGKAQAYLDGCFGDEDERMTTLANDAMNAKMAGHGFFKIIPPDKQAGRQFCRVVVLDPNNVTLLTDPEDCERVLKYTISYDGLAEDGSTTVQKRQVIQYQDVGKDGANKEDYWTIQNYAKAVEGGQWTPLGAPIKWPHPWAPIVDHPNFPMPNQRWGLPEVTPGLIQSNKAINFVASSINALGYYHGHPWMIGKGFNTQSMRIGAGVITGITNPNASVEAIQATGDIPGLMAFEADLREDMDEQSHTPSVATGRMSELPKGQMSGVAIQALYGPRKFKTIFERRVYGKAIRELCSRMLALGGFGDGTDLGGVRVLLQWSDPMIVDDLATAQAAQIWLQNGVSKKTVFGQNGLNYDVEADQKRAEDADAMTAFSQGQGMPGMPPMGAQRPPAQQHSEPDGDEPTADEVQPPQSVPPVNHPAAKRQRAIVKLATDAAKTMSATPVAPKKRSSSRKKPN